MTNPHWITMVLNGLRDEKFYGAIVLKFRDGQLVLIEKTQTILPPAEEKVEERIHA